MRAPSGPALTVADQTNYRGSTSSVDSGNCSLPRVLNSTFDVIDQEQPPRWAFIVRPCAVKDSHTYVGMCDYYAPETCLVCDGTESSNITIRGKSWTVNPNDFYAEIGKENTRWDQVFLDNTTVSRTEYQDSSTCSPERDGGYVWGFSFLSLFYFCVSTVCYEVVLAVLYLDAWQARQRTPQHNEATDVYHDILHVGRELTEQLGGHLHDMTPAELSKVVKREHHNLRIQNEGRIAEKRHRSDARLRVMKQWVEGTILACRSFARCSQAWWRAVRTYRSGPGPSEQSEGEHLHSFDGT